MAYFKASLVSPLTVSAETQGLLNGARWRELWVKLHDTPSLAHYYHLSPSFLKTHAFKHRPQVHGLLTLYSHPEVPKEPHLKVYERERVPLCLHFDSLR